MSTKIYACIFTRPKTFLESLVVGSKECKKNENISLILGTALRRMPVPADKKHRIAGFLYQGVGNLLKNAQKGRLLLSSIRYILDQVSVS